MYLVTGSIASGTKLISQYLHALGISMTREQSDIWEDPRFLNIFLSWKRQGDVSNRKEFIRVVKEVEASESALWGFKCPLALLNFDIVLDALVKFTSSVTVIHVVRDFNETVDCWLRKPEPYRQGSVESTCRAVVEFHTSALSGKPAWELYCNGFHVVNVRDVINNSEAFWRLLDTGLEYTPIESVLNPNRLRASATVSDYPYHNVYDLLERAKWIP